MLRSMTGFGAASLEADRGSVDAEVRSLNSRGLDVRLRLPSGTDDWEGPLRELVRDRTERGRVELSVDARPEEDGGSVKELDRAEVESYLNALHTLRDEYGLPGEVDVSLVARSAGLLRERRVSPAEWVELDDVRRVVASALDQMVEMREEEGAKLAEDFRGRLGTIRDRLDRVAELAPERLERERERLRASVRELVEDLDGDDEQRIAREIALLADKWDIGEELTRARSHVDAFREYLEEPAAEPVGKRLKFLAQELHREINTMGAKGNDAEISREVVEMKNQLEGIREQVENVE